MRTVYLADRIVVGERRLACRRALVFVTGEDGHPWHAVLYDSEPQALEAHGGGALMAFGATTLDGLWLEGMVELGTGDAETRMHCLRGLGRLEVSGETARHLPSAALWTTGRTSRVG